MAHVPFELTAMRLPTTFGFILVLILILFFIFIIIGLWFGSSFRLWLRNLFLKLSFDDFLKHHLPKLWIIALDSSSSIDELIGDTRCGSRGGNRNTRRLLHWSIIRVGCTPVR